MSIRKSEPRIAGTLEVEPPDVRAVGEAPQDRLARLRRVDRVIDAEIRRGAVRVLDVIRGGAVAQVNPTDVRSVNVAGADILPDLDAVRPARPPVHPADVRAVAVGIAGADSGGGARRQGQR